MVLALASLQGMFPCTHDQVQEGSKTGQWDRRSRGVRVCVCVCVCVRACMYAC